MLKRQKFILVSFLLALGFILINLLEGNERYWGIGSLSLLSIVFFFWVLKEGIGKNATLLTLILPSLFTLGVGLFWFLLPTNVIARIPVVIIYGIGIYILCLTNNIFTVSAIRTIALSRAARGVGFVVTLFTSFLIYDAVMSLKISIYLGSIIIYALSFPIFIQGLWQSKLTKEFSSSLLIYSLYFSYAIALGYIFIYFLPVTVIVGSIFLTVGTYVLLGLGQAKIEGRLFKQTIREYLIIGSAVFLVMLFVTNWRG